MILFGVPNSVVDRNDRGMWLTNPFDLYWKEAEKFFVEETTVFSSGLNIFDFKDFLSYDPFAIQAFPEEEQTKESEESNKMLVSEGEKLFLSAKEEATTCLLGKDEQPSVEKIEKEEKEELQTYIQVEESSTTPNVVEDNFQYGSSVEEET